MNTNRTRTAVLAAAPLIALAAAGAALAGTVLLPEPPRHRVSGRFIRQAPKGKGDYVHILPPTEEQIVQAAKRQYWENVPGGRPRFNFGRRRLLNRRLIALSMKADRQRRERAKRIQAMLIARWSYDGRVKMAQEFA